MEENTRIVSFEQGWNSVHLQRCLTKLKNILEGHSDTQISPDEYSMAYTTIYRMCTEKPPYDYSWQLYDKYREIFEYHITSTALPSLREKYDYFMLLSDFVRRWSNHKLMVMCLSRFFNYLDRHLQNRLSFRPLNVVALACFRDRVYEEMKGKVRDAVLYVIDQERRGMQIDRALLKKAIETFVEIGNGLMEYYENDFESSMLEETSAYYSCAASYWISIKSFPDYILKAEECLEREKERALAYLDESSEPKLLENVQRQLLSVYATRLFKDKHCDYSQQLYDKHRETFEDYITLTVLPSLREKHDNDDAMLREFVRRWSNHKLMVRWLSRFSNYPDHRYITCKSLPPLNEVGFAWFDDLVYQQVRRNVRDAVILLIHQEREGEKIDRVLLKNVVEIFVEIGKGRMEYYENDFESYMLKDTSSYYSCKASNWIKYDTFPAYMLKAEECLEREKDRSLAYLYASSEPKLLEQVQNVLSVYAIQLLEKENPGLLRDPDNKGEELSRMYRLFSKIPQVLEHVSNMFKQHVTYESTRLAEQAEDAVSNNKVFVRKVIELFYKYSTCVNDCFDNHTSFHEKLKDAFELFCRTGVAGSSSAELVATFCDIILEKDGSEKLSEDTLKVVKLLAYVSDKDLFAEFYRKTLTRRLLFDESANVKNERSVLTQLKQQYGRRFTSEMEEMVNDVDLPKEIDFQFKENMEFDWL